MFIIGGHINPAVTMGFATVGRFPWRKVPHYITAQVLGAFCAAGCVYGIYYGKAIFHIHLCKLLHNDIKYQANDK